MKAITLAVALTAMTAAPASGQQSLTCTFVAGPRIGATQHFPSGRPAALWSQCTDGQGSVGIATPDGVASPRGRFALPGGAPSCTDIAGTSVPFLPNESIGQLTGLATVLNGRPVIYLRMSRAPAFHPAAWEFLLAHECGHHALGQVAWAAPLGLRRLSPQQELAADCYAMEALQLLGKLTPPARVAILQTLSAVPGDESNYPGPERVARIQQCAP